MQSDKINSASIWNSKRKTARNKPQLNGYPLERVFVV